MANTQNSPPILHRFKHSYLNISWYRPRRWSSTTCKGWAAVIFVLIMTGVVYLGGKLKGLFDRLHWRSELTWYDIGWYGFAPITEYQSFDHSFPAVEFLQQDSRCSHDYIFFAPRGSMVNEAGGVILDAKGDLVWKQVLKQGETQDFRVQEYLGEQYLTFWVGKESGGRKQGSWFMMDNTYTIRHEISPGESYATGDMHEFEITSDDTALITIYEPIEADLSAIGGPARGYLLDSIFQEISINSGEIIFEWSASSHVPIEHTFWTTKLCRGDPNSAFNGCGNHADSAFDYYHLNSVQKDQQGNYLISGRNVHTISYIDGRTGEIIWNLGGQRNEFQDVSDGEATDLLWQHHARWHVYNQSISLFNNGGASIIESPSESHGMIVNLDIDHRTAALQVAYYHPQEMKSLSQGNVQILDDTGNVFIGWGRSAAFTEFSLDGEVLCDARFGASLFFSFGPVTSYRTFRHGWVGKPTTSPDIVAVEDTVYVSWNGATEVVKWQLEGAIDRDEDEQKVEFGILSQVYRQGFETEIQVPIWSEYSILRVVALGADDEVLGISNTIDRSVDGVLITPVVTVVITLIAMLASFLATLAIAACLYRRLKRKQRWQYEYELVGEGSIQENEEE